MQQIRISPNEASCQVSNEFAIRFDFKGGVDDDAAIAGNIDAYSLASASQARQKS